MKPRRQTLVQLSTQDSGDGSARDIVYSHQGTARTCDHRALPLQAARRRSHAVQAAEAIGTKRTAILFREIIPNILPALFAYALINAGYVIVVEGTLSYLGLSVQIPEPTWGNMINEGRRDIRQTILPIFWPGLFLTLTVVSLNLVGDWLQQRVAVRSSAL